MTESATRTRTRQAILAAAVTVFARDPSAALGEVAAAAGVGRTTLHRYFAERSDLLAALAVARPRAGGGGDGARGADARARRPRRSAACAASTSSSATC